MKATSIEKPVSSWGIGVNAERWQILQQRIQPGDRVLDYGCGQGAYVRALTDNKEVSCTGMDIFSYPHWEPEPAKGSFLKCDGNMIPSGEKAFEVSFAFEVLEHCLEPEKILKELCRVTSRMLLVSVPNCHEDEVLKKYSFTPRHWIDQTHVNFWTEQSFRKFVEKQGCKVLSQHAVYQLDLCRCYWESTRLPVFFQKAMRRIFSRWSRSFYSSTLLVISCEGQE